MEHEDIAHVFSKKLSVDLLEKAIVNHLLGITSSLYHQEKVWSEKYKPTSKKENIWDTIQMLA